MSIIIKHKDNVKLDGMDAFNYSLGKEKKQHKSWLYFLVAVVKSVHNAIWSIEVKMSDFNDGSPNSKESCVDRKLNQRKVQLVMAFPYKPETFSLQVFPDDVPSEPVEHLHAFLHHFCPAMERGSFSVVQIFRELDSLEKMVDVFEKETESLDEKKYKLASEKSGKGKKKTVLVEDTPENQKKFNLPKDEASAICLKHWRMDAVDALRGQIVQLTEKIIRQHTPKSAQDVSSELLKSMDERIKKCEPEKMLEDFDAFLRNLNVDQMVSDFSNDTQQELVAQITHDRTLDLLIQKRDAIERLLALSGTLKSSSNPSFKAQGEALHPQIVAALQKYSDQMCPTAHSTASRAGFYQAIMRKGSNNNKITGEAREWLKTCS